MNAIGDRMKRNYENPARHYLTRRVPVIVRVDGRAFHSFSRYLNKPFDLEFMGAMVTAARQVASDMQGFKMAYIQSDEVSFLLTDYDRLESEAWFGYNKSKVESIAAAHMTAAFTWCDTRLGSRGAMFDARAFNIPVTEVANYFLCRAKDWERNSLQMYARSVFSHRELHGKKKDDIHEMLHHRGLNWTTDLPAFEKNGTYISVDGETHREPPSFRFINDRLQQLGVYGGEE